jgi:hypothetical protein
MAVFRITMARPGTVEEAWRRVTDWDRHAAAVPFTTLAAEGRVVAARTRVGPFGFDDVMDVVEWHPPQDGGPAWCRLEKRGPVVTGWAEIEVRPLPGRAVVQWREDLRIAALPRLLDRPTARAGRLVFRRTLRTLLAPDPGSRP